MALAADQNIPEKPKASEPWTFKRLLGGGTITTLAKVFVNPLDILLGYLVVVIGISELMGRRVSWFLFGLTILILGVGVIERHLPKEEKPKK